jgi:hypothetical protein
VEQDGERSRTDEIIRDAAIRAKVATIVESGGNEKDSRWKRFSSNSLINLIVGFLLTGLIGTWLTTCYQSAAEDNRRAAELREVRRSERLATLDTVGAILNEGYYIYGIYYDAKSRHDRENSTARRADFERFNERLEKREILDAARLCVHFGESANDRYVNIVAYFHAINPLLRRYNGDSVEGKALGELIYLLRDALFGLTRYLATEANSSSVNPSENCRVPPPLSSGGSSSRMR